MDSFLTRKRPRAESPEEDPTARLAPDHRSVSTDRDEDSTELKLATLASLHPDLTQDILLEALLNANGDIDTATAGLGPRPDPTTSKTVGFQSTLSFTSSSNGATPALPKPLTRKGHTLYLYSPKDIEQHTPCSIIHNFLPQEEANLLLTELLAETPTFQRETFQLFDRTVSSPHTYSFYVDSAEAMAQQKTQYVYNGAPQRDVRRTLPQMRACATRVQETVNAEIGRRIKDFYPGGRKLRFQSPDPWIPNASFVNCYDGGKESVGYHSDQLSYLGPRAVIGSLSLGVARVFRVRRIAATAAMTDSPSDNNTQGQIAIHLPHNSLLVMHAEMQEEWKHAIAPARTIDPHPVAGSKRINITYRYYKPAFHPRFTPRCECGIATVLRFVRPNQRPEQQQQQQKKKGVVEEGKEELDQGWYAWMCHANYVPGQKGCGFFERAVFDDDGMPAWALLT